jgi:hypothetical protein
MQISERFQIAIKQTMWNVYVLFREVIYIIT